MNVDDLKQYYKDIRIPSIFITGNKHIEPSDLIIDGTNIIDFEKLMIKSYQLILFRDNIETIKELWKMILVELNLKNINSTIDLKQLQEINEESNLGLSNTLLIDMIASATQGSSLTVSIVDFAYVLGKLNKLDI